LALFKLAGGYQNDYFPIRKEEQAILVIKISVKLCSNFRWYGRHVVSRDSSVGIATGYGLADQGEREFKSR
jgi:hypothetical protein